MNSAHIYNQFYFNRKYRYYKKKRAIQRHYLDMLLWANKHAPWNICSGSAKKALDVGCAYGFVVDLLERLKYDAVGVDISKYALMRFKREKKNLLLSDASHCPFRALSFDLITCFEVLEHLQSPMLALRGFEKLLKPQGVLLATTPSVSVAAKIIQFLTRESMSTHPSVRPPEDWYEDLSSLGLSWIRFRPYLLLPIPPTLFGRYFSTERLCLTPSLGLSSHVEMLAVKSSEEKVIGGK